MTREENNDREVEPQSRIDTESKWLEVGEIPWNAASSDALESMVRTHGIEMLLDGNLSEDVVGEQDRLIRRFGKFHDGKPSELRGQSCFRLGSLHALRRVNDASRQAELALSVARGPPSMSKPAGRADCDVSSAARGLSRLPCDTAG